MRDIGHQPSDILLNEMEEEKKVKEERMYNHKCRTMIVSVSISNSEVFICGKK